MCGFSFYADQVDRSHLLEASLDAISHRGPDGSGSLSFNTEYGFFGAVHARLSIQDISDAGSQPMISSNNRYCLVFNGEIYNKDVLSTYIKHPVLLRGTSDTEVLLESFASIGTEIFSKIQGIFAAIFFDQQTGTVIAVRDQMGVKPLYYSLDNDGLFLSSEIRGLRPFIGSLEFDEDSFFEFLRVGFVHEPNTGFSNVLKVPPGQFMVYQQGSCQLFRYFDVSACTVPVSLEVAVSEQLVSDVPVANLFSGGIDSSVIAFLSGVPGILGSSRREELEGAGNIDDTPYAIKIAQALNIDLVPVELESIGRNRPTSEFLRQVEQLAAGTEELLADATYFTARRLCQEARKEGYKVLLSGTGGDEVFIGYPRYRLVSNKKAYRLVRFFILSFGLRQILLKFRPISKKLDRFIDFFNAEGLVDSYLYLIGPFRSDEISDLWLAGDSQLYSERMIQSLEKRAGIDRASNDLFNCMRLDYLGFLSHNLTVLDKASMAVGVEVRVPLLDQRLYRGMLQKVKESGRYYGKKALLDLLKRSMRLKHFRRRKSGFAPPLDNSIANLDVGVVHEYLHNSGVFNILNEKAVRDIFTAHSKSENNTYKIFNIIYFGAWLRVHCQGYANEN